MDKVAAGIVDVTDLANFFRHLEASALSRRFLVRWQVQCVPEVGERSSKAVREGEIYLCGTESRSSYNTQGDAGPLMWWNSH